MPQLAVASVFLHALPCFQHLPGLDTHGRPNERIFGQGAEAGDLGLIRQLSHAQTRATATGALIIIATIGLRIAVPAACLGMKAGHLLEGIPAQITEQG